MVSSTLGSPTKTCWKRRSSAGSFSMRSRYSSSVVAPIMCSSPRASIGLSMLPASIAESPPAPAPTTVCSSSMKVMTWPPASLISSRTALSRSSNSPRYFAPATIAARSSDEHAAALERVGHVAGDHALGEALDDGGLADAGLADQDGVVLGAPRQHLDDAADLGVAADDRVEPAVLGRLGEVDGVLLQRLVRRLGGLAGHPAVAADGGDRLPQPGRGEAGVGQHLLRRRLDGRERDEQVVGGDVVVLHRAGEVERRRPARGSAPAEALGCWTVEPVARGSARWTALGLRQQVAGVDAGLRHHAAGWCRPPAGAARRAGGSARCGCCRRWWRRAGRPRSPRGCGW